MRISRRGKIKSKKSQTDSSKRTLSVCKKAKRGADQLLNLTRHEKQSRTEESRGARAGKTRVAGPVVWPPEMRPKYAPSQNVSPEGCFQGLTTQTLSYCLKRSSSVTFSVCTLKARAHQDRPVLGRSCLPAANNKMWEKTAVRILFPIMVTLPS